MIEDNILALEATELSWTATDTETIAVVFIYVL